MSVCVAGKNVWRMFVIKLFEVFTFERRKGKKEKFCGCGILLCLLLLSEVLAIGFEGLPVSG